MEQRRTEFRKRMDQFKLAREANPLLTYWEWKAIPKYDEGTEGIKMTPEQERKFLEDRQKYARMSGAVSPVLNTRDVLDMTPVGNATAVKDIYDATVDGNYLDAGLIGASLVVPAAVAKPARKYIPTVTRTAALKINALLDKSKVLRETDWNNQINRSIERIYDKDVRNRAAQIKRDCGVDIQSQYDKIHDLYTNNYESIPKAKITEFDDASRAKMNTNESASKVWSREGKPAGLEDFEMQVRRDVEPSSEVTDHEVNHWWTYAMMLNPDWRRSELQKITKDFEGALHGTNPLDPANSKYYSDWMELNAYGINVINSMKELDIPITKENVTKFINAKPNTSAQKRAAYQFKNMDLYYKWLQTMPLAGMAGAAYMINNKEDNSYADGTDAIEIAKTAASFLPIVGTALDVYEAIKDPNLYNIGYAGLSLAADLSGMWMIKGLAKTARNVDRLQLLATTTRRIEDRTNAMLARHDYEVDKAMIPIKSAGMQLFDGIVNLSDKLNDNR